VPSLSRVRFRCCLPTGFVQQLVGEGGVVIEERQIFRLPHGVVAGAGNLGFRADNAAVLATRLMAWTIALRTLMSCEAVFCVPSGLMLNQSASSRPSRVPHGHASIFR